MIVKPKIGDVVFLRYDDDMPSDYIIKITKIKYPEGKNPEITGIVKYSALYEHNIGKEYSTFFEYDICEIISEDKMEDVIMAWRI